MSGRGGTILIGRLGDHNNTLSTPELIIITKKCRETGNLEGGGGERGKSIQFEPGKKLKIQENHGVFS